MTPDSPDAAQSPRRAEAGRHLRDYLAKLSFVTPTTATRRPSGGRPLSSPIDSAALAFQSRPSPEPGLNINVNLHGGTIFLDNERQLGALAKQIKRLITEDSRRGIGL